MGQSRNENILENMLGASNPLGAPQSREEALLMQLLEKLDVTVLKWAGVTTTPLTDGASTNPITVDGKSYTAVAGDTVSYESKEFVFSGTIWQEFGDLSGILRIIGNTYDSTATYEVGDYTIYENKLYICTTAITTPEVWNGLHWQQTTIIAELSKKADKTNLATVATSGNYNDLNNKPSVAVIDDSTTADNKAWSSSKVSGELDNKASADEVDTIKGSLSFKLTPLTVNTELNGYIIIGSTGEIRGGQSTNYAVYKFEVEENKTYYICAATNWANMLYLIKDANDNIVEKGQKSANTSARTVLTDEPITMPANSKYVYVSGYNFLPECKVFSGYDAPKKWLGKKWVVVGDSLTEVNIRAWKRYYDYVSEKTGISVVNMGLSGTGYARLQNENKAFYQRISSCPADADVVTIFGSFNDGGAGIPLGTYTDNDNTTIAGCINLTIDNLQTVIPLVNLGIVSPTPWTSTHPVVSSSSKDYVDMLETICKYRSIPFLNLWECSNLRPWDNSFRAIAYSRDEGNGVHPDENGHKLIAPRFEAFLDSLLLH